MGDLLYLIDNRYEYDAVDLRHFATFISDEGLDPETVEVDLTPLLQSGRFRSHPVMIEAEDGFLLVTKPAGQPSEIVYLVYRSETDVEWSL